MRVYRVTVPAGIMSERDWVGPYQDIEMDKWSALFQLANAMSDDHSWGPKRETHPVTFACYGAHGCVSMQQLFKWFGGWLPKIMSLGGRIEVHDISEDDVLHTDDYQIAWSVNLCVSIQSSHTLTFTLSDSRDQVTSLRSRSVNSACHAMRVTMLI